MIGKYVITDKGPIVISSTVKHNTAVIIGALVESAAWFCLAGTDLVTYGESTSLGLKARPEDAEILKKHFHII